MPNTTIGISWPMLARFLNTDPMSTVAVDLGATEQSLQRYWQARYITHEINARGDWVYYLEFDDARQATEFILKYA